MSTSALGPAWPVEVEPWTGPAWAAPERAERWARRPRRHWSEDPLWGYICTMMAKGHITPEHFRRAVRIKIKHWEREHVASEDRPLPGPSGRG